MSVEHIANMFYTHRSQCISCSSFHCIESSSLFKKNTINFSAPSTSLFNDFWKDRPPLTLCFCRCFRYCGGPLQLCRHVAATCDPHKQTTATSACAMYPGYQPLLPHPQVQWSFSYILSHHQHQSTNTMKQPAFYHAGTNLMFYFNLC